MEQLLKLVLQVVKNENVAYHKWFLGRGNSTA